MTVLTNCMVCHHKGAPAISWQSYFTLGFLLSPRLAKSPSFLSSSLLSDALASCFTEKNRSNQNKISASYLLVHVPAYSHVYLLCSCKVNLYSVFYPFCPPQDIAPAKLLSYTSSVSLLYTGSFPSI